MVELLRDMRDADRAEVSASAGDVGRALAHSLAFSDEPLAAANAKGELLAVFGVVPVSLVSDTASIWLLGTPRLSQHSVSLLSAARRYIPRFKERYPKLFNYVDARNTASISWLRALKFTFDPPAPYGKAGLPFYRFHTGFDDV